MAFSLVHLVHAGAQRRPDNIALEFGDDRMSYAELWTRAASVGAVLREYGVKRGERVGILMNRSFDSFAGIIGAMQAGATYVPFNASAPLAQLSAIMEDCEIRHLIVDQAHADQATELTNMGLPLDFILGAGATVTGARDGMSWSQLPPQPSGSDLNREINEQDPCLIFFTSGSTGRPKGVVHSHRSMLANVEWAVETFGLTETDRFSNVTSHHFDLSWFEMYASIAVQAATIMMPESTVRFPPDLAAACERARLTVWCSVPSVLMQLTQRGNLSGHDLTSLRLILTAGERFPTKNLKEFKRLVPSAAYCNMYGTTETHIAAYLPVPDVEGLPDDPLPIGYPCAHVNLDVLAPDGERARAGETGELVIRGPSVMEGYWRLPERSQKALQRHKVGNGPDGTYYHTGDLARRLPNGTYEIIGRNDRRVKVRGYFVDLDEIEKVMLSHPAVHEVAAFQDPAEESGPIHAIATLHSGHEFTAAQFRIHIGQHLPLYAVPQQIAFVADLPRTGSSKISRAEIPAFAATIFAERRRPSIPQSNVAEQIRRYATEELLSDVPPAFSDEAELLDSGLIDSLGVARLVAFIESDLGLVVANDDFIAENFASLGATIALVRRLADRNAATAAVA